MGFKRYTPTEILVFLKAIDHNLASYHKMIIIGGTAAALGYGFTEATQDIDTANSVASLKSAIIKAEKETGFSIPVNFAAIAEAPAEYESRLTPLADREFRNLKVFYPEAMDLVFMKMMRLEEHDLRAINQIIEDQSITADRLLERYKAEVTSVTKSKSDLDFNFLAMIEVCFGEKESERLKGLI